MYLIHNHCIKFFVNCSARKGSLIGNKNICIVFIVLYWRRYLEIWRGPLWSWSYGSLIYNYLCNQFLSPLTLWVLIQLGRGVLDTTLCDKVCQWLATCRWFCPGTPVSSTNKTDCHDITEILLKVPLNTIPPEI